MRPLLELKDLSASYGQVSVLHKINLTVKEGRIVTLLGANGAGKTTLLRAISNMMLRLEGSILLDGRRIDRLSTESIARSGIAHVPDGRGTLGGLTVEENLALGACTRKDRAAVREDFKRVYGYFPKLHERRHQQAGTLSGGEQQMLAISRALVLRPRLLLLDEPSFGLAPIIVEQIFAMLRRINEEERMAMLVIEQNVRIALALAHDAYLMETGRIVKSGSADELGTDESVRHAYLGY